MKAVRQIVIEWLIGLTADRDVLVSNKFIVITFSFIKCVALFVDIMLNRSCMFYDGSTSPGL